MNAYDIDTRIADEGRVPLAPLVQVHELSQGGLVMQDENVKVTAALVHHPPVVPAFALSLRRRRPLDRHLRGHCAVGRSHPARPRRRHPGPRGALPPGVDRLVARVPNAADPQAEHPRPTIRRPRTPGAWRRRPASRRSCSRTSSPPEDPAITDQMWIDAARRLVSGPYHCRKGSPGVVNPRRFPDVPEGRGYAEGESEQSDHRL